MDNTKQKPQHDKVFVPFGVDMASFLVCKGQKIFCKVSFTTSVDERSCMYLIADNKSLFSDMGKFYEDNVMDKCVEYVDQKVTHSFSIESLFEHRKKLCLTPVLVTGFKGFSEGEYPEGLFDEVSNDA